MLCWENYSRLSQIIRFSIFFFMKVLGHLASGKLLVKIGIFFPLSCKRLNISRKTIICDNILFFFHAFENYKYEINEIIPSVRL